MTWPLSQDYNEAIQNPATSLGEPVLKRGQPALNAMGLPIPRSGSFADVYQFTDGDGKTWALKCFTRQVKGLQARYAAIDEHLRKQNLPFTVGFRYLAEGIRIRGQWYPLLQMEWVEGFTLNEFIRDNADKKAYLESLFLMWVRLCKRLRQAEIAHGDLQHGNVLLVPSGKASTLGLKLIDYDGMWVPALANKPSGEAGHPAYQHPARRTGIYNADVDRFPHLLIACALRSLIVAGPKLWKQYDNGDNLLFREDDIRNPTESNLIRELWELNDPIVQPLLGHLVLAAKKPLGESPWLDELMESAATLSLSALQRQTMNRLLQYTAEPMTAPAWQPVPAGTEYWEPARPEDVFAALALPAGDDLHPRVVRTALSLYWLIPLAAVAFGLLLLALPLILLLADRKPTTPAPPTVHEPPAPPPKAPVEGEPAAPPKPMPPEPEREPLPKPPREDAPPRIAVLAPVWSTPGSAAAGCFDFTRDGKRLVAAAEGAEKVDVYAVRDGHKEDPIAPDVGKIKAVTAAGQEKVMINGDDNESGIWDVLSGERLRRMQTPMGDVTPFSVSADEKDAICPGQQGWRVLRFGLDTGMTNKEWSDPDSPAKVTSVRYSPTGSHWVAVDDEAQIVVRDLMAGGQVNWKDPSKIARTGVLSATNKRLITFGAGPEIRLWDVPNRKLLHTLPGHAGGVRDAVLTADDRWVISVGADKELRVWDVATGREVQDIDLPEAASCVRLFPKGNQVATAGAGGDKAAIQLWRIDESK